MVVGREKTRLSYDAMMMTTFVMVATEASTCPLLHPLQHLALLETSVAMVVPKRVMMLLRMSPQTETVRMRTA